jgi:hypothetical protein
MTRLFVSVSITLLTSILGVPLGLARADAGGNEFVTATASGALPGFGVSPSTALFGGKNAGKLISLTEPRDLVPAKATAAGDDRPAQAGPQAVATATHPSLAYRVGASVGAALLVLVVGAAMIGVQRARRRRVDRWYRVPTHETAVFTNSAPGRDEPRHDQARPPPIVGWHADPDHLSDQVYWDGQSWTARRRWSGTAWVEVE